MECSKVINYYGGKAIVEVKSILEQLGNQKPYFSTTAMIYKATKNGKRDMRYRDVIGGGCCHEEILKAFPGMKDAIALHLSDNDGVPMYAFENGWYFIEKIRENDKEYTKNTIMNHLRIDEETADKVIAMTKEEYKTWVENRKPVWKNEADEVIKKYNLEVIKER